MPILLANATLTEAHAPPRPGHHVLIEGDRIAAISDAPIAAPPGTPVIDVGGRRLLPGLIDAHVHIVAALADLAANAVQPSSLAALRAGRLTTAMLDRGFTTVRDVGGADAVFGNRRNGDAGPRCRRRRVESRVEPRGGFGEIARRRQVEIAPHSPEPDVVLALRRAGGIQP